MQDTAKEFVRLFESGEFFKAHEVLEKLWFARRFEKTPEILLLKGLINASVSFELNKRNRHTASLRVWQTYEKYKKNLSKIDTEKQIYYKTMVEKVDTLKQQKV